MAGIAPPSHARLSRRRRRLRPGSGAATLDAAQIDDDAEPPFDPPAAHDVLSARDDADGNLALALTEGEALELTHPATERDTADDMPAAQAPVERRGAYTPPPRSALPRAAKPDQTLSEIPVPPITIHASWDRPEIAESLAHFAADPHLSRASISIGRGGLDGAITRCSGHTSPDLLIIDTTLGAEQIRAGLDRLADVTPKSTKIIIIGAVNDVALFRDLAARGISEYIVPPSRRNDLIRTACRLFADADHARVIAVMGARGGVGASTIAQNLAWSIAARGASVSLVDLDPAFGASAFSFAEDLTPTGERACGFEWLTLARNPRLQIVAAPAVLKRDAAFDEAALDQVLRAARRTSAFVVLDVPHDWSAEVKQALVSANDTIIVSGPDLASLRNCEAILRQIKAAKKTAETCYVMSMTGVRARPEILARDFVEALGVGPAAILPFEPELIGMAAIKGQCVGEIAPRAKWVQTIEAMAQSLTGLAPMRAAAPPRPSARAVTDTTQPDLVRYPLTFLKPGEVRTRETAPASIAYLAAARAAAESALHSARTGRRGSALRGTARVACLTALLVAASAWCVSMQRQSTLATEQHLSLQPSSASAEEVGPQDRPIAAPASDRAAPGAHLLDVQRDAQQGSAQAQYELAQRYERGDGAPADLARARRWTERAAASGHCLAMHDLGVYFANGEGAPRDDAAAFRWFRQAAEFGLRDSQYNLGIFYQQALGVSASLPEALFWFTLAARQGDASAQERADTLAALLPPVQVEQARARAQAFQPRVSPACPIAAAAAAMAQSAQE